MGYLTVGGDFSKGLLKRKRRDHRKVPVKRKVTIGGHRPSIFSALVGGPKPHPSLFSATPLITANKFNAPAAVIAAGPLVSASTVSPSSVLATNSLVASPVVSSLSTPSIMTAAAPSKGGGGGGGGGGSADEIENIDDLEEGEESDNPVVKPRHSWLLYAGLAAAGYFLFIKK